MFFSATISQLTPSIVRVHLSVFMLTM